MAAAYQNALIVAYISIILKLSIQRYISIVHLDNSTGSSGCLYDIYISHGFMTPKINEMLAQWHILANWLDNDEKSIQYTLLKICAELR